MPQRRVGEFQPLPDGLRGLLWELERERVLPVWEPQQRLSVE